MRVYTPKQSHIPSTYPHMYTHTHTLTVIHWNCAQCGKQVGGRSLWCNLWLPSCNRDSRLQQIFGVSERMKSAVVYYVPSELWSANAKNCPPPWVQLYIFWWWELINISQSPSCCRLTLKLLKLRDWPFFKTSSKSWSHIIWYIFNQSVRYK